jgi:hypothetical protein
MRQRGESHEHDRPAGVPGEDEFGETMDLESALIQRLRTMEWPKPTDEQRERCLQKILEKMNEDKDREEKKGERYEASRFEVRREDRYPITRRANDNRYASTRRAVELRRSPISTPRQSVRLTHGF